MREKLIELLSVPIYPHEAKSPAEVVADYLLDNGVTIQKWIPVTERLPDDFSENLCRVIRPIPGGKYVRETRVLWCDYDKSWSCEGLIVTHWMPLPEAPKEE